MNFFDKLTGKDGNNKKNKQNPLANVGKAFQDIGKAQKFHGGGQSLGGAKPGKLIAIELSKPGELGMKVSKKQKIFNPFCLSLVINLTLTCQLFYCQD